MPFDSLYFSITDNKQNHTPAQLQFGILVLQLKHPALHVLLPSSAYQCTISPGCVCHPLMLMRHTACLMYCKTTTTTCYCSIFKCMKLQEEGLLLAHYYTLLCVYTKRWGGAMQWRRRAGQIEQHRW